MLNYSAKITVELSLKKSFADCVKLIFIDQVLCAHNFNSISKYQSVGNRNIKLQFSVERLII